MYREAYKIVSDTYIAEDAVHEAVIKITNNISKLQDINSKEAASYVARTVKTTCYNILKRGKFDYDELNVNIAADSSKDENNMLDVMVAREQIDLLLETIKDLPPHTRDILERRYYDNMSHADIAAELNINEATARKRMERAVAALRTKFKAKENAKGENDGK